MDESQNFEDTKQRMQKLTEELEEESDQRELNIFVHNVKEYIDVDDEIKVLSKQLKDLRAKKTSLEVGVMSYMQSMSWEVCNINTGGKLMVKKSITKGAVKKDASEDKLKQHFENNPDVLKHLPQIMEMIFDKRDTQEKDVLKRTTPRGKKT
jgi:hypothetical protein